MTFEDQIVEQLCLCAGGLLGCVGNTDGVFGELDDTFEYPEIIFQSFGKCLCGVVHWKPAIGFFQQCLHGLEAICDVSWLGWRQTMKGVTLGRIRVNGLHAAWQYQRIVKYIQFSQVLLFS